jgi:arylsulfatase
VFGQEERLVVDYNAFDDHAVVESDIEVPVGASTLSARFRRGDGRSGSIAVAVDGVDAGEVETALFMRMISSVGASIGHDHGSAVSPRYRAPFPFTGTVHEIEIQVAAARDAAIVGSAGAGDADTEVTDAEGRAEMARQ